MKHQQEITLSTADAFALVAGLAKTDAALHWIEASAVAAPTGESADSVPFIGYLDGEETHMTLVLRSDGTYSVHAVVTLDNGAD